MPQDVQKDASPDMGRDAEQAPEAGPAGTEIDAPLSPAAARSRDRRHRRRGIRRVLAVGLVGATLAVAIVLAVGFASFREFAASNRLREELLYSSLLRSQLESIFEALLSAESGTLGYIVTGREEFLEPLAKARNSLPGDIAALIAEAWARPQHAAALAELAQLSVTEVALLDQMVANRNAAGSLSASAILDTRRGKMVMDEIRELVKAVSASELALSDARTHDVRRASQRTKETLLLLLSAVIAVVVGSSLVMVAHLIGRRRAELQLAETLTNHRAILSSAMDAIVTVDADGRIATANPAVTRLFGWSPDELEGAPIARLFAGPQAGAAQTAPDLAAQLSACADGQSATEFVGLRKDGSTVPLDVAVGRMGGDGGLVAILHDISERKRAEVMKNEFVSTVSHELRTPLTSIAGSLGLLDGGAAGPLPPPAKKLVGIAHENSRRLVRLVNDILDIQKMQSGAAHFASEPVAMDEVARRAAEQNAGFAEAHGVRLSLTCGPGDLRVSGDADRLMQVLTNLISNAVKFSPRAGTVSLTVARDGEARVRVAVRDFGSGIPEDFRARIFTRFAQADSTDTRQRGGTGLGLAIVKDIVERHGGAVSFETQEGAGTIFYVDLPALHVVSAAGARSDQIESI